MILRLVRNLRPSSTLMRVRGGHAVTDFWPCRIRPSSNVESPLGKPDVLYFVPASAESQDYMTPVDIDEIKIAEDTCAEQPQARGCCS